MTGMGALYDFHIPDLYRYARMANTAAYTQLKGRRVCLRIEISEIIHKYEQQK